MGGPHCTLRIIPESRESPESPERRRTPWTTSAPCWPSGRTCHSTPRPAPGRNCMLEWNSLSRLGLSIVFLRSHTKLTYSGRNLLHHRTVFAKNNLFSCCCRDDCKDQEDTAIRRAVGQPGPETAKKYRFLMVFQLLLPRTLMCPKEIHIFHSHTLAHLPRTISVTSHFWGKSEQKFRSNQDQS